MVITFKTNVPLSETMIFEEEYKENLQMDLQEKMELLEEAIVVWMFVNNELVGESYGIPLHKLGEDIEGCSKFRGRTDVVYCYSNTIIEKYQKLGLGSILKAFWLGMVRQENYTTIVGHARPNGSQELNKKFGAKLGEVFKDWYETGEDYIMYQLDFE